MSVTAALLLAAGAMMPVARAAATTTPDGSESQGATCEATEVGTQLDYGVFGETASLDPTLSSGSIIGGTQLAALYDVLMRYDFERGEFVPQLAESLERNETADVWTLTLREGITFDDGSPLTAQLVSDNIDRFFGEGVRNNAAGFMGTIESKRVVDDRTLEFTLRSSNYEFPLILADEPGMVVNLAVVGDDATVFGSAPPAAAGVGPYVLERNAPGEEIVLKARQNYWNGPVCIETLRFVYVPGAQATLQAFEAGDLDVGFLREPASIAAARDAGYTLLTEIADSGNDWFLNHAEGRATADPRVREAFILAIDPNIVNDRAYNGTLLSPGKSLVAPSSPLYSDGVASFPTDSERAAQLVEEAKADGWDGHFVIAGQSAPPLDEVSLALEAMLEAVGMDVEVRSMSVGDQIGALIDGDFDAGWGAMLITQPSGGAAMSRALLSDSSGNRMRYASPEMDAAIAAYLAAPDLPSRQQAIAQISDVVQRDFVYLPLAQHEEGIVIADDVHGIKLTSFSIHLFDDAYMDS